MESELLLGRPDQPAAVAVILKNFVEAYAPKTARFVFAYASLAGLRSCLSDTSEKLNPTLKRWLVGIHHGVTEPAALREIAKFPNCELRIFSPTSKMNEAALWSAEKLHAKIFQVLSDEKQLLVVGSANLTRAAMGATCTNFEACTSSVLEKTDEVLKGYETFPQWFGDIWNKALPTTDALIDRYATLRESLIETNPVIIPDLDEYPVVDIGNARHLWIEAGAMSGGDRNQVEFGPTLARFFGPTMMGTQQLRVRFDGVVREDRPLSYKTTQWGTDIWRLSLITSNQGGPSYPNRIIHLTRTRAAAGDEFVLAIADPNSSEARRWKRQANRLGTIAQTGIGASGRTYGVY
jgi:HKD family nuclease